MSPLARRAVSDLLPEPLGRHSPKHVGERIKAEAGPVDAVDVVWSGVRVGGNKGFSRGGSFPSGLLEKGDEVANLVDSSLMKKTTERPLQSRANTGSSLAKDVGVLLLAFPHLKPTATSWSENVLRVGCPTPQTDRHRPVRKKGG